jgi:hypothetical protein
MCKPDQLFAIISADVITSALVIAGLVLLGVFTYRVIVRTRRPARK